MTLKPDHLGFEEILRMPLYHILFLNPLYPTLSTNEFHVKVTLMSQEVTVKDCYIQL